MIGYMLPSASERYAHWAQDTPWHGAFERAVERYTAGAIDVVDTHTCGNPTRIVLGGLDIPPDVVGVEATRVWLRESADWVRRRLVHEPRGGGLTCAVVPVPQRAGIAEIGAVILEPGSYPPMCGHCMIGFSVVVDELGLVPRTTDEDGRRGFTIHTPAGPITASVLRHPGDATEVTIANVDSYVVDSWEQNLDGQRVHVDLLWGGDYYASVDATALDLSLDREHASQIERLAQELSASIASRGTREPRTGALLDIYQVLFHETLAIAEPSSRVVVVAPPGVIDRSPCGTGSSALLALLVARGDVPVGQALTTRSIIDSAFTVSTSTGVEDGDRLVVSPRLTGTAHITGLARVVADPTDRLGDGFPPI